MEFDAHRPIYLQIVETLGERILDGRLAAGDRAPSARDLAREIEVTPNTVTRACVLMQEQGILENRRGIGYFVAPDALEKLRDFRKQLFIEEHLPTLFRNMRLLDIDIAELERRYSDFLAADSSASENPRNKP